MRSLPLDTAISPMTASSVGVQKMLTSQESFRRDVRYSRSATNFGSTHVPFGFLIGLVIGGVNIQNRLVQSGPSRVQRLCFAVVRASVLLYSGASV